MAVICTTGDIIVFQACTALTSVILRGCNELTGKAKETLTLRHT